MTQGSVLAGKCKDCSGHCSHGINYGAALSNFNEARYDGINDYIEGPAPEYLNLGSGDFSIAVWVHSEAKLDDVIGDILSKYDPAARTRRSVSLGSNSGTSRDTYDFFGRPSGRTDGILWCWRALACDLPAYRQPLFASACASLVTCDWPV